MITELKSNELAQVAGGDYWVADDYEPSSSDDVYCYQERSSDDDEPYQCDYYTSQGRPVASMPSSTDDTNYGN